MQRGGFPFRTVVLALFVVGTVYLLYLYNTTLGRLRDAELSAERYRREEETKVAQLQEMMRNKDELQEKCDNDKQEFTNRLNSLNQQHKMLKSQYDEHEVEQMRLEQEARRLKEEFEQVETQRNQEYQQLKQEKELEVSSLKDQIANVQRQNEQLQTQISGLKAQVQNGQQQLVNQNSQLLNQQQQVQQNNAINNLQQQQQPQQGLNNAQQQLLQQQQLQQQQQQQQQLMQGAGLGQQGGVANMNIGNAIDTNLGVQQGVGGPNAGVLQGNIPPAQHRLTSPLSNGANTTDSPNTTHSVSTTERRPLSPGSQAKEGLQSSTAVFRAMGGKVPVHSLAGSLTDSGDNASLAMAHVRPGNPPNSAGRNVSSLAPGDSDHQATMASVRLQDGEAAADGFKNFQDQQQQQQQQQLQQVDADNEQHQMVPPNNNVDLPDAAVNGNIDGHPMRQEEVKDEDHQVLPPDLNAVNINDRKGGRGEGVEGMGVGDNMNQHEDPLDLKQMAAPVMGDGVGGRGQEGELQDDVMQQQPPVNRGVERNAAEEEEEEEEEEDDQYRDDKYDDDNDNNNNNNIRINAAPGKMDGDYH